MCELSRGVFAVVFALVVQRGFLLQPYSEISEQNGPDGVQNTSKSLTRDASQRKSRETSWQPPSLPSADSIECGIKNDYTPLILKGRPTQEGEYPWLVALFYLQGTYEYRCAATLISNKHVITAAHCVPKGTDKNKLYAVLGSYNIENWMENSTMRKVKEIAVHPEFVKVSDADVAVITVEAPVTFSDLIRPICLWDETTDLAPLIGGKGTVAGWGTIETGISYVNVSRQIDIPIVEEITCVRSNINFYTLTSNRTFCAGARDGRIPCTGDSGSGFVMKRGGIWRLRGVVSAALSDSEKASCDGSHYAIFADVPKYNAWLTSVLKEEPRLAKIISAPPSRPVEIEPSTTSIPSNRNREEPLAATCGTKNESSSTTSEDQTIDYPWVAALYERTLSREYDFLCTCNFLTRKHVITAGVCVQFGLLLRNEKEDLLVVTGYGHYSRNHIAYIEVHPDYEEDISTHNLAILILTKPVSSTLGIEPLCMWSSGSLDAPGVIAGSEGTTSSRSATTSEGTKLKFIPSDEQCLEGNHRAVIKPSKRRSTFCGATTDGAAPCRSDRGAAFMVPVGDRWRLRGILVQKAGKCIQFADVTKELDWIQPIID